MHDLTAAHRTLPLGTRVLVTNLDNGDVVEVRINDRGPFGRDRILDLSYSAARMLGAVNSGIIRVRLSVVALPPTASPDGAARFAIQLGAFTTRERAEALVRTLARDETEAAIAPARVGDETYYRVRVGNYADRQSAQQTATRLAGRGYRAIIVER
jgi:rare lipoprotein A